MLNTNSFQSSLMVLYKSLPQLLKGAAVSIQIAALSCIIGLTLGVVVGLTQSGKGTFLKILATIYVTLFRGTPMLIQLLFAFFVLPEIGISLPAFWIAVITIGLNSGAYVSQIIRAGIKSVSKGQLEAAKVLGFSKIQITRYILLPQAIRTVIPALGNEFIILIKDSSLASIITVVELTKQGERIISATLNALPIYTGVALLYLIMTSTLSFIVYKIEKRLNPNATN